MSAVADLERYRLISKIGSGGMATVDLAEDTLLRRRVALKRIEGAVDVSGLSRLRREALAGASLNHPNLVSVYDILTLDDGDLVIVMEYVEGETLRDLLARKGALAPADALPLLAGVAAGLDAIHGAGIVHRDVKPSNILLGEDGAIKVADLGVASVPDRTQITTSGSIIGSLNYMAPEQLDAAPATPAIDIYALAAVAFEVLSGAKAHKAQNPVALAHAIATKPPPSLTDAWPAAPRAVTDLLMRAMSRHPRDRPGSAGRLVVDLEAGFDLRTESRATEPAARTMKPARRTMEPARRATAISTERVRGRGAPGEDSARSRRWILPALAVGLVCAAAALIVLLNQTSSPPPKTVSTARPHSHKAPPRPASSSPQSTGQSTGGTTTSSASAPATTGAAASPTAAVESFYRLAAARDYSQAWALADAAFRAQLGGYRSFEAGQANDRSITFDSARVTSQTSDASTVTVRTTSVQSDGTHRCSGSVDLVSAAAGHWLVHQIHINCT